MGADLDTEEEPPRTPAAAGGQGLKTREQLHEEMKAEFLASHDPSAPDGEGKKPPQKPARRVVEDDDGDDGDDGDANDEDLDSEDDEDDLDLEDEDLVDEDNEGEGEDEEADDEEEERPARGEDADEDRRLERVRREEQRSRARIKREDEQRRAEFSRERDALLKEWQPKVAAAERFEQLRGRAAYAMVDIARELGVDPEHYERIGRDFYAHSKGAADKPEFREAAQRASSEREAKDALAALQKKHAELEKRIEETTATAAADREVDAYLARVARVARKGGDETPLTKTYLATSPKEARAALEQVAFELAKKIGRLPKPASVLKAHESRRRAELRKFGVDVSAASKTGKAAATTSNGRETKATASKPDKDTSSSATSYSRGDFLRDVADGNVS